MISHQTLKWIYPKLYSTAADEEASVNSDLDSQNVGHDHGTLGLFKILMIGKWSCWIHCLILHSPISQVERALIA